MPCEKATLATAFSLRLIWVVAPKGGNYQIIATLFSRTLRNAIVA